MTPSAQLQAALEPGEDLLWSSQAHASQTLSDYGGVHELIARFFLALSALMTLIFFLAMQTAGAMRLSMPLLICVGGPIAVGLIIRQIGRRRMRERARKTQYGVTSHRILVADDTLREAYFISAETCADIIPSAQDRDVLRYIEGKQIKHKVPPSSRSASRMLRTRTSYVSPHEMVLPKGEAEKAQTVINLVKASL